VDLTPAQFKASVKQYKNVLALSRKIYVSMVRDGISPQHSASFGAEFDQRLRAQLGGFAHEGKKETNRFSAEQVAKEIERRGLKG